MEAALACCCPAWRHYVIPTPSNPPRCAQGGAYEGTGQQSFSRVSSSQAASRFWSRNRLPFGHPFHSQAGAERIHRKKHGRGSSFTSAAFSDNGTENDKIARENKDEEDQILRCISLSAEVSVIAVKATEVVQEAQRRHRASPTASAALGRALVGTLLLGAMKADAETVQVTFLGEGPLGQMTTIAGKDGYVKGFVGNPLCNPPLRPDGKLDVGAAVGPGVLSVVRNNSHWSQPYTGTIPIYSGEVAEDIAHYLADSDQTNTAIGLGVSFTKQGAVTAAGGFLVQILPFCSEETLSQVEDNIVGMAPISDSETVSPRGMVEHLLKGIGVGDFSEPVIPRFGPCGVEELKPRMMRAVASLGPSDVRQLLEEQGHVEVRCEFCAEVIRFKEPDLHQVFQTIT